MPFFGVIYRYSSFDLGEALPHLTSPIKGEEKCRDGSLDLSEGWGGGQT